MERKRDGKEGISVEGGENDGIIERENGEEGRGGRFGGMKPGIKLATMERRERSGFEGRECEKTESRSVGGEWGEDALKMKKTGRRRTDVEGRGYNEEDYNEEETL